MYEKNYPLSGKSLIKLAGEDFTVDDIEISL